MCGLTGFLQADGSGEAALIQQARRMTDSICHRGPDDEGIWADEETGAVLGFRRLAILDLSPTGHQPMTSANGRFVIIFNGEIYNYRDLRAELEAKGIGFRGSSDTEVILAGAVEWGMEAVIPKLWGMFALALWDRQERVLLLARDRLGKKPMYYTQTRSAFLFGSELKALRAHPSFEAEVDREALTAYLRFGYVPTPQTIYKGVNKLPAGAYALVRPGQLPAIHTYWSAREAAEYGLDHRLNISEEEAVENLDHLLRDSVARRMIADVPLGALLSGGIDSSAVTALMQAQSNRPVKTYTIGFKVQDFNEAEMAKAIAAHLGTEHTELYVTEDEARAVIPRLPDLYDEPFADSSQIPVYLVSQLARQHVTVALSGDGGDELFAGYTRYLWAESIWRRLSGWPGWVRTAAARAIESVSPLTLDKLYEAAEPVVPKQLRQVHPGEKLTKFAGLLSAESQDTLYRDLVSWWKEPEMVVVGGHESNGPLDHISIPKSFANFTERMMVWDILTYLPDDILVKVDRASMGVSLEARAPLLDHRLVEWAWQLPLNFKLRNGQGKWLVRQVLYRYVPAALVERPKQGFGVPIDNWLRGPLRDWAEGLLAEERLARDGFFNPKPIRALWQAHLAGSRNEPHDLWAILMFQAWKERWL